MQYIDVPSIGKISEGMGFVFLENCSDGIHIAGKDGVRAVVATGDRKVEFVVFRNHTLAYVCSSLGYPAYYPLHSVALEQPVKAVLMDLDGTTVRSEEFWIWIIEMSVASLLNNPKFSLVDADIPFVSGHSVSEHLSYCIQKYCPEKSLDDARTFYFAHTKREMDAIVAGNGRNNAFTPTEGVREFLLELKSRGIKLGLVTSGLYEKAWPEILSAFQTMKMGDPRAFYDGIISAGFPLKKGAAGTLGELSPKPHPWLYAETCAVGLGLGFEERNSVVGIEDSGAGICSVRLAGYSAIGISGGNIEESGTKPLCNHYCKSFQEILHILNER